MSGDEEMAALLPAPPADAAERKRAFDAATKTTKQSSPVKALFERVAAHDPTLTEIALNVHASDNALNMEWTMWPDTRKAAALALLCGNPHISKINLAGTRLNDAEASALASALGADSKVEVLNLERNALREPGLLAIVARSRRMRPRAAPDGPEHADHHPGGGGVCRAPRRRRRFALVKFSPSMRNPNERRVDAAPRGTWTPRGGGSSGSQCVSGRGWRGGRGVDTLCTLPLVRGRTRILAGPMRCSCCFCAAGVPL